jgi:EAL and modified HD-GYP domain-containing signal transduction protein
VARSLLPLADRYFSLVDLVPEPEPDIPCERTAQARRVLVGRQPIFDRKLQLAGYELLFRATPGTRASTGDEATARILEYALVDIGLDRLIGDARAFINMTRSFLLSPNLRLLPRERTVLEVLEDVEVDDQLVASLRELSALGYTIALDDFVLSPGLEPLLDIAHIVKLDVMALDDAQLQEHVGLLRARGLQLLAEKVETRERYHALREMGFDLFQGYFFARPTLVSTHAVPANKLATLQLLRVMSNPDCTIEQVAQLMERDPGLSHKALRSINAAGMGLQRPVSSIHQAVVMLGLRTIRNLLLFLSLSDSEGIPHELMLATLARARACGLLAQAAGLREHESYFTTGLLSTLDTILGLSMKDALKHLALDSRVAVALTDGTGSRGEALACVRALEDGEVLEAQFGELELATAAEIWLDALAWSNDMHRATQAA